MKLKAKSRTDGQKSHIRLKWGGRAYKTRRGSILPEPLPVNVAVTWDEGYCTLFGEVCVVSSQQIIILDG